MVVKNSYELAVQDVADWMDRIVDEVVPAVMGGKTPPFSVRLKSDREIYEVYRRMTPEQAQSYWAVMEPEEQQKLSRIMQQFGGGYGPPIG